METQRDTAQGNRRFRRLRQIRGRLPPTGRKKGSLEVWSSGRGFAPHLTIDDKARNGGRRSRSAAKPQSNRWGPAFRTPFGVFAVPFLFSRTPLASAQAVQQLRVIGDQVVLSTPPAGARAFVHASAQVLRNASFPRRSHPSEEPLVSARMQTWRGPLHPLRTPPTRGRRRALTRRARRGGPGAWRSARGRRARGRSRGARRRRRTSAPTPCACPWPCGRPAP